MLSEDEGPHSDPDLDPHLDPHQDPLLAKQEYYYYPEKDPPELTPIYHVPFSQVLETTLGLRNVKGYFAVVITEQIAVFLSPLGAEDPSFAAKELAYWALQKDVQETHESANKFMSIVSYYHLKD